jgi:hypothetical protein
MLNRIKDQDKEIKKYKDLIENLKDSINISLPF